MKKILTILLVVATGFFLSGFATFSNSRVAAFLSQFEDEINKGYTDAACSRISESIEFSLVDTATTPRKNISGGKTNVCELFEDIAYMYKTAPIADNHYMSDIVVKRSFTNWNTATVSYIDHHDIEFFPMRTKLKTRSVATMTIVKSGDSFVIKKWSIETSRE